MHDKWQNSDPKRLFVLARFFSPTTLKWPPRSLSVDGILVCDHSNESYSAVLSCGTVYYAVRGGSNFYKSVDETLVCDRSNESY